MTLVATQLNVYKTLYFHNNSPHKVNIIIKILFTVLLWHLWNSEIHIIFHINMSEYFRSEWNYNFELYFTVVCHVSLLKQVSVVTMIHWLCKELSELVVLCVMKAAHWSCGCYLSIIFPPSLWSDRTNVTKTVIAVNHWDPRLKTLKFWFCGHKFSGYFPSKSNLIFASYANIFKLIHASMPYDHLSKLTS